MKLTLESDEIIRILAKHFNIRADSCKITLKKKPFEIELSGIPMEDDAPRPREPRAPLEPVSVREETADDGLALARADRNVSLEPPPPGRDYLESSESKGALHPAAVLEESKKLQAELDAANPRLAAQQRGFTARSNEEPTSDFKKEI